MNIFHCYLYTGATVLQVDGDTIKMFAHNQTAMKEAKEKIETLINVEVIYS